MNTQKLKCRALTVLVWPGLIPETRAVADWQHLINLCPTDIPRVHFTKISLIHLWAFLYSSPTSPASIFTLVISELFTIFRSFFFVCLSVKSLPSPSIILCDSFRSCSLPFTWQLRAGFLILQHVLYVFSHFLKVTVFSWAAVCIVSW